MSAPSSALVVTLIAPVNVVINGNFASGSFSGWTLGGNYTSTSFGPEIFIDTDAEGGTTYAAGMGSVGSDGTLSQTIATTAGQTYTLSFWLQNEAVGDERLQGDMERADVAFARQRGAVRLYGIHLHGDGHGQYVNPRVFCSEWSKPVGSRQYLADGEWNVVDDATCCSGHQHRRGQCQRDCDLDRNRAGWFAR